MADLPKEPGFAALYRHLAEPLCAWAHLHLRPELHALVGSDDLVQEIWCRAYQVFDRYDAERGSFRGWLFGIAEKVLLEHLRRARRGRRVDYGFAADLIAEMTSISERASRSEFVTRLLTMAATLAESDRRLITLRGLEEQPFAVIGERLGMGAEAARSRWRRLRAELRERLGDSDVLVD